MFKFTVSLIERCLFFLLNRPNNNFMSCVYICDDKHLQENVPQIEFQTKNYNFFKLNYQCRSHIDVRIFCATFFNIDIFLRQIVPNTLDRCI
jgi:hypothetical protein